MQILRHNVSTITLIRHGPPAVSIRQRVAGYEFRGFIERYDAAKIKQQAIPPAKVAHVIAQADQVFASHHPRATHTAKLLGASEIHLVDPCFREIEFPVDFTHRFRLSALTWTAIALTLWRLGHSAQYESFLQAKQRARNATDILEQEAYKGSVALVAHGGINRLIAKELRQRGWQGPRLPHSRHWGCTTYRL